MVDLVVLCDFDGTITNIDTAEFVLSRFSQGNWRKFDKQLDSGKITLEECLKKEFSLVRASRKQILNELKDVVTFRQHFEDFAGYCRTHLIPIVVVSAGLDFVIEHFLDLHDWRKLVTTYMAKTRYSAKGIKFTFPNLSDKTSANFKHDLVRSYKKQGKRVVYIGDGAGDYAAAKDADFPFAIEGSRLATLCAEHEMCCTNVTDFAEVVKAIRKAVAQDPRPQLP